ncbi:MAG: hypothetical protein H0U95_05425 [Bacteroidetes bacterium]|nr:hypothetical protein [Bacteroidota bacterium]
MQTDKKTSDSFGKLAKITSKWWSVILILIPQLFCQFLFAYRTIIHIPDDHECGPGSLFAPLFLTAALTLPLVLILYLVGGFTLKDKQIAYSLFFFPTLINIVVSFI